MKRNKEENYLQVFYNIADGTSRAEVSSCGVVYFKHPFYSDFLDFDDWVEEYKAHAEKRGMMTNEERTQSLIEDDVWSEENEAKIAYYQNQIQEKEDIISHMMIPSRIKRERARINDFKGKLNHLLTQKLGMLGVTVERFAEGKVNEKFLYSCTFKDKQLTTPLINPENQDAVSRLQLSELLVAYSEFRNGFDDDIIQKMCLESFAKQYYSFVENPMNMYNKCAMDLSMFQLKTIVFMRVFKSIFENHDIPMGIEKNPEAIFDFVKSKSERERIEKKSKMPSPDDDTIVASTYFGANQQDYQEMAVEGEFKDINQELKKRGGKMNSAEFMDFLSK